MIDTTIDLKVSASALLSILESGKDRLNCPECNTRNTATLAPDFESVRCKNCGKVYEIGLVKGVNAVNMPDKDFIDEHKHLVKVLKKGSHEEHEKEAEDQEQELIDLGVTAGGPGSGRKPYLWAIHPKKGVISKPGSFGHTAWFAKVGLPDRGKEFDRIKRGVMWMDPDTKEAKIWSYNTNAIPNEVVSHFQKDIIPKDYDIRDMNVEQSDPAKRGRDLEVQLAEAEGWAEDIVASYKYPGIGKDLSAGGPGSGRHRTFKWAYHPSGRVIFDPKDRGKSEYKDLTNHASWFSRIGLTNRGYSYDKVLRGYVSIDPSTKSVEVFTHPGWQGTYIPHEPPSGIDKDIESKYPAVKTYHWHYKTIGENGKAIETSAAKIQAGGPGSGCHGDNCGRPSGPFDPYQVRDALGHFPKDPETALRTNWNEQLTYSHQIEGAYNQLADMQKSVRPPTATPEEVAITSYVNDGYLRINKQLRGQSDYNDPEIIKALTNVVANNKIPADMTLFRGATLPTDMVAQLKPGGIIEDKAFVSTSMSSLVAVSISSDENVLMRISVDKDTPGFMMNGHSEYAEAEVLLQRGAKFQVESVETVKHPWLDKNEDDETPLKIAHVKYIPPDITASKSRQIRSQTVTKPKPPSKPARKDRFIWHQDDITIKPSKNISAGSIDVDADDWAEDIVASYLLEAAGTSEGAEKAWDTRGRGRKEQETQPKTSIINPIAPIAKPASSQLRQDDNRANWPDHIQALKLPPAWKNIKISDDPNADLLAIGKDAKGRDQYVYSEKFKDGQAALKFERIKALEKEMPMIDSQLKKLTNSDDENEKQHADCAYLIRQMGIRPGSEQETGAKVKAYGATTLEGQHVVVNGDKVSLNFVGKKGVSLNLPVTDPKVAQMLKDRKEAAGDGKQLFPKVSDSSLRDFVHEDIDHGGFKVKDFRTALGTSTAQKLVDKMPPPTDAKSYQKAVKSVGISVSKLLGNTPTVALQSYIAPQVFSKWEKNSAMSAAADNSTKLPDVYYGPVTSKQTNFRDRADLFDDTDDDAQIETPPDVIAMLGFDPAAEQSTDQQSTDQQSTDQQSNPPIMQRQLMQPVQSAEQWASNLVKRIQAGGPGSGRHPWGKKQHDDSIMHNQPLDKATIAKLTFKPATKMKQAIADQSEQELSKALGITRTQDNKPFDLVNNKVAIEIKTVLDNANDKVTIHPSSKLRKLAYAKAHNLKMFTVVADKRGPVSQYYWKGGVGSFRIASMNKAATLDELKIAIR